nr:ComEC/Rec2 family competence protein [Carboxylicivirga sp. M1479]
MSIILSLCIICIAFLWLLIYWFNKKAKYRYRSLSGLTVFLTFILIGNFYMQVRKPMVLPPIGNDVAISVRVIEMSGETPKNYTYEVQLHGTSSDSINSFCGGKGLLYLPKKICKYPVSAGDKVQLLGRFIPFTNADSQFDFDYCGYLRNQRFVFRYYASSMQIDTLDAENNSHSPIIFSAKLKEKLRIRFLKAGLQESNLAILNALFLGDKSRLTYDQKSAFSNAGAMHLLAVSGLHVGIIYMMILVLLQSIGFKKKSIIVALIIILLLWFYALITGFSPSVMRASIMFSILEIGRTVKRKTGVFNLLGASMFIIICFEPLSIFNIGFWLSHVAVASIVSFYPYINNWFSFNFPPFKWLWSIIAVSLAAQIGTLPLCIYAFHSFPVYFILANVFLIPIVTPVLILAVLSSVFSFSITCLQFIIPGLDGMLSYMEAMVIWIESLPYSSIEHLYLQGVQMVLTYLSIVFLLIFIEYRWIKYFRYLLYTLTIVLISFVVRSHNLPQELLYVANVKGKSVVNHICPDHNTVYSSDSLSDKEIDFALSGLWAYCGARSNYTVKYLQNEQLSQPVVILINSKRIALVPDKAKWRYELNNSNVDYLLLMGQPNMTLEEVRNTMRIGQIVIPNAWKYYQKKKWLKNHAKYVEKVHDIYQDGVLFIGLNKRW